MAVYAKKMFGMFYAEERIVKLECANSLAGVIIDRFGKDVMLIPKDDSYFTVNVKVAVSLQFLAWIIGLGEDVKILEPKTVVDRMNGEINRLIRQYR